LALRLRAALPHTTRPLAIRFLAALASVACLLAITALLSACAGAKSTGDMPIDSPVRSAADASSSLPAEGGKYPPDKAIARLLAGDNVGLAQSTADSLSISRDPMEREIGRYWKAVCYLYRDRPESAVAILEPMQGKWSGGLRAIHGEAFLRLAREASEARAASRVRRDEAARLNHENDVLAREFGALKAEIARLETEKRKYERLIKDLETIR
jgi:hypothetical protein